MKHLTAIELKCCQTKFVECHERPSPAAISTMLDAFSKAMRWMQRVVLSSNDAAVSKTAPIREKIRFLKQKGSPKIVQIFAFSRLHCMHFAFVSTFQSTFPAACALVLCIFVS